MSHNGMTSIKLDRRLPGRRGYTSVSRRCTAVRRIHSGREVTKCSTQAWGSSLCVVSLLTTQRLEPDHCGFRMLQYTYATRRCTHAYLATFYPALLYKILPTQQSSILSPYHTTDLHQALLITS